ncbi:MAG: L-threonylcarbamoyladenylate synthase [Calditrichia bacterium]
MARILEIRPQDPDHRVVSETVRALENGQVVCYPTDTIYGLGVDLLHKKAMKRVEQIKQKSHLPLSFICSDFNMVSQFARVDNATFKIMKRCLPGPFTFVLPATNKAPDFLLFKKKTVGIRIPDYPFCQLLVEELGRPVLSTSVPSGEGEVLNDVMEIDSRLGDQIDLIIDGGRLDSVPSTVVEIVDREITILREGKGNIDLIY